MDCSCGNKNQNLRNTCKVLEIGNWNSSAIKYYDTIPHIQKQLRKGNWEYLCSHPEIRAIIRLILHQAINASPKNVRQFVADFFNCGNTPLLVPLINSQLKYVTEQLKLGRWSKFDAEALFMESRSTHSLMSNASTDSNVPPVLTFVLIFKKPDECGLDQETPF